MKRIFLAIVMAVALVASPLSISPATAGDKPDVYFTFDDGPSADGSTELILETAKKYGAQITFFVVGYRVRAEPGLLKAAHEAGHAIGNHTWNHPHMPSQSLSAQTKQLLDTQEIVSELTGYEPTCWRPPYGDTNEMTEARGEALGLTQVLWTVGIPDFNLLNRYKIHAEMERLIKAESIVLLHDGANNRRETAAAFEMWMKDNWDKYDFKVAPGCAEPTPPIPGPFDDVYGDHIFATDIEWVKEAGITKGCDADGTKFCPDSYVTRGQMAAFLDRALELPSSSVDYFSDDNQSLFEESINSIMSSGITKGCGADGTKFCPDRYITRGEMATFLDRALDLPVSEVDYFTDDEQSLFENSINSIRSEGITKGCNSDGTKFCPDRYITRGEMAAFLTRALRDK